MSFLARLLNHFYKCGLPGLPVVLAAETEDPLDWSFQGWLARSDLDRAMSDLDRMRTGHTEIPADLLINNPGSSVVAKLAGAGSIPVLNLRGESVAHLAGPQIPAFLNQHVSDEEPELHNASGVYVEGDLHVDQEQAPDSDTEHTQKAARSAIQGPVQEAGGTKDQLATMILNAYAGPLFAIDLRGQTLFFNRNFEKRILPRTCLEDSIRTAETYFLESARSVLSRAATSPDAGMGYYDQDLDCEIQLRNLEAVNNIVGYLFILQPAGHNDLPPRWRSRLEEGESIDTLMEDVEARLIFQFLSQHGQNVSHTAKALGLKRSTLQNKIKRLNINSRFNRRVTGPIRRIRRTRQELARLLQQRARPGDTHGEEFDELNIDHEIKNFDKRATPANNPGAGTEPIDRTVEIRDTSQNMTAVLTAIHQQKQSSQKKDSRSIQKKATRLTVAKTNKKKATGTAKSTRTNQKNTKKTSKKSPGSKGRKSNHKKIVKKTTPGAVKKKTSKILQKNTRKSTRDQSGKAINKKAPRNSRRKISKRS